jgi:hypothetical protein
MISQVILKGSKTRMVRQISYVSDIDKITTSVLSIYYSTVVHDVIASGSPCPVVSRWYHPRNLV